MLHSTKCGKCCCKVLKNAIASFTTKCDSLITKFDRTRACLQLLYASLNCDKRKADVMHELVMLLCNLAISIAMSKRIFK